MSVFFILEIPAESVHVHRSEISNLEEKTPSAINA